MNEVLFYEKIENNGDDDQEIKQKNDIISEDKVARLDVSKYGES